MKRFFIWFFVLLVVIMIVGWLVDWEWPQYMDPLGIGW